MKELIQTEFLYYFSKIMGSLNKRTRDRREVKKN